MSSQTHKKSQVTYFTCTLGEAANLNSKNHPKYKTVNDLLDFRAEKNAQDYAVGFPVPDKQAENWQQELFTFEDLQRGSIYVAIELASLDIGKLASVPPRCIALLCPSSLDFLFMWLGLMRAGHSVLLLAPQCSPEAIAHLCKECDASILYYHNHYTDLASSTSKISESSIRAVVLPWQSRDSSILSVLRKRPNNENYKAEYVPSEQDTAYIHHTSGTSSGLPKPIPQSHHAGVGVLPSLDGKDFATFTTTPLYHGGVADCFRAWTSSAMIWLFPGTDVPITTKNILCCLSTAADVAARTETIPQIKYFTSVPYILQMLAEDSSGLSALKSMDLVGVGGAALPSKIGDDLVQSGVNLLSRFGSAECGFLLSSQREHATDKEWQYLRLPSNSKYLRFEKQEDELGLSELIVLHGWPHLAKTNRDDESFATSDLFEPHPRILNAWKYHSRSDSQITLITGKKFDPAPIEDAISASSPLIRDVLIFGNGRQNPGALIFRSETADLDDKVLEEKVRESFHAINAKGQEHTIVSRDMLVVMPANSPLLEKSSKGTVLRKVAEKTFSKEIEKIYAATTNGHGNEDNDLDHTLNTEDMTLIVRSAVEAALGRNTHFEEGFDFYQHGVDSTQCASIRNMLKKELGSGFPPLPWNVVYDCGNISRLTRYIINLRGGEIDGSKELDGTREMLDLVQRFSTLKPLPRANTKESLSSTPSTIVLLTGATGALGSHILDLLRDSTSVTQIICLVRATDNKSARLRVLNSLLKIQKDAVRHGEGKVLCVPSRLGEADFGVTPELLGYMQQKVTHIIHAAWAVNFSLPLKSFVDDHITGLHNLLNLALSCERSPRVTFCSSTASVLGPRHNSTVREEISTNPEDADSLGYSRSKWVAESICSKAAALDSLRGKVSVLRIGQLTGDIDHGIWNMSEAWPLMISTVDEVGCLPALDENLDWLPLNIAAQAVAEIGVPVSATRSTRDQTESEGVTCPVYHLINGSSKATWMDLLGWIEEERQEPFEVVSAEVWLEKLEALESHPAKNLIWLWRNAYGNKNKGESADKGPELAFDVEKAEKASEAIRNVGDVNRELVSRIWSWLRLEAGLRE